MFLPKPPTEKEFETAPAGAHAGRCFQFIDLGTQPHTYNNVTSLKHKIRLGWELPMELMKDARPFAVFQTYNWSMHTKSTLRNMLENWRGQKFTDADFGEGGFDTKKLIGATCTISVVHNLGTDGHIYDNIASVSRAMKGVEIPPMVNPALYFSFDSFDGEVLNKLSQKMRDSIMKTPEYETISGHGYDHQESHEVPEMGDVPF